VPPVNDERPWAYIRHPGGFVIEPTDDITKWGHWYTTANRQLRKDHVAGAVVSTVFLGIDHRCGGDGPPVLWETMIFGGTHDGFQDRYTSEDEAFTGHARVLGSLLRGVEP
jgi:hypothetical protein